MPAYSHDVTWWIVYLSVLGIVASVPTYHVHRRYERRSVRFGVIGTTVMLTLLWSVLVGMLVLLTPTIITISG